MKNRKLSSLLMFSILLFLFFTYGKSQNPVSLLPGTQNDSMVVHIKNKVACPFLVVLDPLKGFSADGQYRDTSVLFPNDTLRYLFSFPINSPDDTADLNLLDLFNFDITYGNPYRVAPDKDFEYTLPFPIGARYQIIQGFNGKKSHNYPRSRYAIDFNMQIGDTICAARQGIVVGVKEDSNKGGNSRKYQPYSNKVVIYHEDGTFAHYAHLKQDGALVELGERVEKGQPIALSGNTGFSSGPHLHFVVRIASEKGEVSIPIQFEGVNSKKLRKSHKMVKRKK